MALGWTKSPTALLTARAGHAVFTFGNRVFAIGGQSSGTVSSLLVECAIVDQGGALNAFKVTASLPQPMNAGRSYFGFAQNAQHGRDLIYIVGGQNAAGTAAFTDTAIGQVNQDGSIAWKVGPKLPTALGNCEAAIVNGWLYCVGGQPLGAATGNITVGGGSIALAVVSGNNVTLTLSAGATFTAPPVAGTVIIIPATSALAVAHASNGGSYIVTGTSSSTVVHATKLQDLTGGTLTPPTATSATPIVGATDVENSGTQPQANNVLASQIQSDGTLGPWIAATSCPIGVTGFNLVGHQAMGSKKYLYVAGGLPQGNAAGTALIYRGIPQLGPGQLIAWDKEQLGMSSIRNFAASPALLLGPLAIVGGSTTGVAAQAIGTADELKLSGDGTIIGTAKQDSLPLGIINAATGVAARWVFLAGGQNSSATYLSTVYQANLQDDAGF